MLDLDLARAWCLGLTACRFLGRYILMVRLRIGNRTVFLKLGIGLVTVRRLRLVGLTVCGHTIHDQFPFQVFKDAEHTLHFRCLQISHEIGFRFSSPIVLCHVSRSMFYVGYFGLTWRGSRCFSPLQSQLSWVIHMPCSKFSECNARFQLAKGFLFNLVDIRCIMRLDG